MASWQHHKLKDILTESKVESTSPNVESRIRVLLNARGVMQRPIKKETKGATKYFIRKKWQFIYGKQNIHKGAFGIIPEELDGFESTSDLPAFDIAENCLPLWLDYYFKQGDFYLSLINIARGVATKRVQPKELLELTIPLPPIDEQKKILSHFKSVETEEKELTQELTHQQTLLKKLRQQILQEAIEGKLTAGWRKENPDVESASELLKRIQKEKEQLIKDKKIKQQKPLPPISEKEKPFDLPKTWDWCRLENVGFFERGKSKHRPRNDETLFTNGKYPFVQTGDIAQSKKHGYKVTTYSKQYNEKGLSQSRLWKKGTLCITIAANIAETGFLDIDACFPDSVVGFISLFGNENSMFVKYYIDATKDEIEKFAPATAQKNINLGIINMLLFPLPPLDEQKAIVAKVEKLFTICDQLENQITTNQTHAQQLMQSVLKEAFSQEE